MRASKRSFATACLVFSAASAIAVIVSGCTRKAPPDELRAASTPVVPSASAVAPVTSVDSKAANLAAPPPPSASAPPLSDARESAFQTSPPMRGHAIGHTSLVLKLSLQGDLTCAYKPRSRKPLGGTRYKSEIAAYRIARALGIPNVPVAIPRAFELGALREALVNGGTDAAKLAEIVADADGQVRGALMPWIKYDLIALDLEPNRAKWDGWLTSAAANIGAKDVNLARQISTMLLFDYYTANWDRWSGGNIAIDRDSGTLLFVDNDGAFYPAPPAANLADQLGTIRRVRRFSRAFVSALRAFGRHKLEAAVGLEWPGVPLLTPRLVDAAEERRTKLLQIIDSKIAASGESNVLYFD